MFPNRICPDQARELLLGYLEPLVENGTFDSLYAAFINELTPLAAVAAERALRKNLAVQDPELVIVQMRRLLDKVQNTFETLCLDPDFMGSCGDAYAQVVESKMKVGDMLYFLESRHSPSSEATVSPSAAVMMAAGSVP
jgi:hypothetical protein